VSGLDLLSRGEPHTRPSTVSTLPDRNFGSGMDPGRLRGYSLAHLADTCHRPTPHHSDAVPTDFSGFCGSPDHPREAPRQRGTGHLALGAPKRRPCSRLPPLHPTAGTPPAPARMCGGNHGAGTHTGAHLEAGLPGGGAGPAAGAGALRARPVALFRADPRAAPSRWAARKPTPTGARNKGSGLPSYGN
jgi:hypothetical protein